MEVFPNPPQQLTAKQQRFCQEYIIDLNATQAAIRANYSKKTADQIGKENLRKPPVEAYISLLKESRANQTKITSDRVLKEIAKLAFSDTRKLYDSNGHMKNIPDLDDDTAACVAGIEVDTFFDKNENKITKSRKIKLHNKVAALDQLARHLGLFEKDNQQASGTIVIKIT